MENYHISAIFSWFLGIWKKASKITFWDWNFFQIIWVLDQNSCIIMHINSFLKEKNLFFSIKLPKYWFWQLHQLKVGIGFFDHILAFSACKRLIVWITITKNKSAIKIYVLYWKQRSWWYSLVFFLISIQWCNFHFHKFSVIKSFTYFS